MYAVWSNDAEADDLCDADADDLGDAETDDLCDADADDLGDAETDDRGDADELDLAMSVDTDHTRTVTATGPTKPKQASTKAFRTHGGSLGSGRWPAGRCGPSPAGGATGPPDPPPAGSAATEPRRAMGTPHQAQA